MQAKTVMIIDDDEDDRFFFSEALAKAAPSSTFMSASDGEIAIKMLQNSGIKNPDIIFLDLNMPRMNGWQCLLLIRMIDNLKYIPVIIFSTSKANIHFEKASLLGNVYFMTKPPRISDLVYGIDLALHANWSALLEMNKTAYA
jgi:CheY-like chemotaxis protein